MNDRSGPGLPTWLHWLESCPSTNSWAIEHSQQLSHGAVVFTLKQTAGRGQQGRVWYAPPGVLTASFVLDLPRAQLSGLSLAAGLAVIYAVEDLLPECQKRLKLKWPNDLLLHERKLAGILCEATFRASLPMTRVVVGIGLNRCVNFKQLDLPSNPDLYANAVSLDQVCKTVPDEMALLQRLRYYLLQVADLFARSTPAGLTVLLPELRDRDVLLDRDVRLELPQETVSGRAVGIDAQGRLLIADAAESVRAFTSGRVFWNRGASGELV
jgi:BirA family transcriptional regulator, biotin operon repressor / biotin---[acetyl-CoA-carboxylase] ligase